MARLKAKDRREKIWELIDGARKPISGKQLSEIFSVSRQIIVNDISLIRNDHPELVSTVKGYVSVRPETYKRVFKVFHSDKETEDELKEIVTHGGKILDITVHHRVYGTIQKPLDISTEKDIENFMYDIKSGVSSLLKNITDGYHFHTVEANDEESLDKIQTMLYEKGYLLEVLEDEAEVYEPKSYSRN